MAVPRLRGEMRSASRSARRGPPGGRTSLGGWHTVHQLPAGTAAREGGEALAGWDTVSLVMGFAAGVLWTFAMISILVYLQERSK